MNRLDLERCIKDKDEYDKKIRSLDYKIVETSVQMYNSKSRNAQFEPEDGENSKVNQLKNKIQQYETEKLNLTKELWEELVVIKTELNKVIDEKIKAQPEQKDEFLITKFIVNKITDVYFETESLSQLSYLLEIEDKEPVKPMNILENEKTAEQENKIEVEEPVKPMNILENEKTAEQENKIEVEEPVEPMNILENEKTAEQENKIEVKEPAEPINITEKEETAEQTNKIESKPLVSQVESNVPKPAAVTIEKPFEIEEVFKPVQPALQFNIEEQRIVDFENLLNHINKTSKDFRTDIEKALSRFIINYQIVKNTQYLQNDFDNIANNYLNLFKTIIQKFKKDESIDALQERIQNQENTTKNIEQQLLTNNIEIKEMQRQMQELSKVYFVGGYVRKIQEQIAKIQGEQETEKTEDKDSTNKIFVPRKDNMDNSENDVFEKIKKLTYDKRMDHIIEVSKWTKNVEEKLRVFHLEETDFQFVIYLIRQTENICNSNFEQVANIIINLCDINLQLELAEENGINKNKKLQEEATTAQILKDGIENIRKKYSKMPFIGRKVSSILSAKLLNE